MRRSPRTLWLLAAALAAAAPRAGAETIAAARDSVVHGTMPYLNVPYLWGGVHPATGLDCSGFTQLVYHQAGLVLPRVAAQQFAATLPLGPREVLPGDLIFFSMENPAAKHVDHVGIYLGKGLFVHASVTNGVHVEPIAKPYYQERLVAIKKFKGF